MVDAIDPDCEKLLSKQSIIKFLGASLFLAFLFFAFPEQTEVPLKPKNWMKRRDSIALLFLLPQILTCKNSLKNLGTSFRAYALSRHQHRQ